MQADVQSNEVGEVSYSAKPSDTTAGDAEAVESVDIEPAKNGGFTVRVRKRGGKNEFPRPENYAFGSCAELNDFLNATFGGDAPDASADE